MDSLIFDKSSAIASITFNRPEKGNAVTIAWAEEMADFLRAIDRDDAVRCLVIRANGRHFMSGGDMDMIHRFLEASADQRQRLCEATIHPWNTMMSLLHHLRKPTIARLQGAVVGPAIGLAAACDFAIAADSAFFLFAHVLNGGSIDGQLTYYLPRLIGPRKTYELCATGAKLSAADAQALGLINNVVPEPQLDGEIAALAEKLAAGPTRAYGEIKRLVRASLENTLTEQSVLEAESCGQLSLSDDWNEGVLAFLEKRRPTFRGT